MEPTPLVAIASDNHLAPRAWARHPTLTGDSYYSFEQLIDYVVDRDVPLLLLGDVIDTPYPDPYTVRFLLNQFRRTRKDTWYIQGNHELQRQSPWLGLADLLDNGNGLVFHAHGRHFSFPDCPEVVFYGLDWQPATKLIQELANLPGNIHVLLAHQAWSGLAGSGCEAALQDVPKASYLFTGDYHVHKTLVVKGADGQRLTVVSPGSQCMQAIDEPEEKAFWVFYSDGSLQSVPIKTRSVCRRTFRCAATFVAEVEEYVSSLRLREDVPEEIAKPIAEIRIGPGIDGAARLLQKAVVDKAHLFLSPLPQAEVEAVPVMEATRQLLAGGLEGQIRYCTDDEDVCATAVRLLSAKNKNKEVQDIIQERLTAPGPF